MAGKKTKAVDSLANVASSIEAPQINTYHGAIIASTGKPATAQVSFKEMQRLHAMRMELFGFGGWLASALFYVLFLVWAYVPEATLEAYGLTYLPSKHWAVAVPAMIVVTYVFSLVIYKAINLISTPGLESFDTIFDTHTVPLPKGTTFFDNDTQATPGIGDIPIFDVNSHFFLTNPNKPLKEA